MDNQHRGSRGSPVAIMKFAANPGKLGWRNRQQQQREREREREEERGKSHAGRSGIV